jgi:hypothetical protein
MPGGRAVAGDEEKIAPGEGKAAGGREAGAAPLVDEDRRALAGAGLGPVPVERQDQVVKRVGAAQALGAGAEGLAGQVVVVGVAGKVAPAVLVVDRHGPGWQGRGGDAVGAVDEADDPVAAGRGGAVAFALVARDAAAAEADRQHAAAEAQAGGGQHQIGRAGRRGHSRWPDFAALVAR